MKHKVLRLVCLGLATASCGSAGPTAAPQGGGGTTARPSVLQTERRVALPQARASGADEAPSVRAVVAGGTGRNPGYAPPPAVVAGASAPPAGGFIVRAAGGGGGPSGGGASPGVASGAHPDSAPRAVARTELSGGAAPRNTAAPSPSGGQPAPAAPASVGGGRGGYAESAGRGRSPAGGASRSGGAGGEGGGGAAGPREYRFSDDVVQGQLVRPDGDMMVAPRRSPPGASAGAVAMRPGVIAPMQPPPVIVVEQPPPPPVEEQQATAGVLTAASVGDCDRRGNYLGYVERHYEELGALGLDLRRRVRLRVVDAQNRGINAVPLSVRLGGLEVRGMSHGDGVWDFFPSVDAPQLLGTAEVTAELEGVRVTQHFAVPAAGDAPGELYLQIPAVVEPAPPALDLAFAIDVTGSMDDELRYVNREVQSIVRRIEAQTQGGVSVRVGATFYRDRNDDLVVQQIPFTTNVAGFAQAMTSVTAYGGGDYPEDMNAGLDAAMNRLVWREGAAVRVLVLIADAPPQPYADENFTWRSAMRDASRRGIRLLPVAASGADRTVEYLFRAMASYTSTPYVYLTDDSGVGGPHQEADTDRVGVERFNDMLVRMVLSDLRGGGMHEPGPLGQQQSSLEPAWRDPRGGALLLAAR